MEGIKMEKSVNLKKEQLKLLICEESKVLALHQDTFAGFQKVNTSVDKVIAFFSDEEMDDVTIDAFWKLFKANKKKIEQLEEKVNQHESLRQAAIEEIKFTNSYNKISFFE